jgi:hypothetical protein
MGFTREDASDQGSAGSHLGAQQGLAGHARPARQPGELEHRRGDVRQHPVVQLPASGHPADEHEGDGIERMRCHRIAISIAQELRVAVVGRDREQGAR